MNLYFAPLEGLTDAIFRRVHAACFGGADRYYTPFLSPNQNHKFSGREKREILENGELPVVPQLLTNHAEHFLWAAGELAALGYREVNLNLGCPSGTVTAKKKGAGQLADLGALERFFDAVFASCPLRVSVKTRAGVHGPEEFDALPELFCRYPLAELTIHPRVRDEFYEGELHLECYDAALAKCPFPVCCNGEVKTAADAEALTARFPSAHALMIGRGGLADPALFRVIRGGAPAGAGELAAFHERLYGAYREAFSGERPVLCRMKEIWSYLRRSLPGNERAWKALRKSSDLREYESAVRQMFETPAEKEGE